MPPVLDEPALTISADTQRRVERAAGGMATRAVALMDERLPWFRTLPPEQRSWVTLVAQAGIGGYVPWLRDPERDLRLADTVFGTAPRDLLRAVSLRRTVELVRVAIDVAEENIPRLGRSPAEIAILRDSLLRYSREIAFAAAAVYATAAETRGAWDARVEAGVVDGIVRGEDVESLESQASALGWDPTGRVRVIAGVAPPGGRTAVATVTEWARANGLSALAGVQGSTLVVVAALDPDASEAEQDSPAGIEAVFADGPIIRGPVAAGIAGAVRSASEALSGLRVAAAWPQLPRPAASDELLVERALAGDAAAADQLRTTVYAPLATAATPLLESLDAYLEHGAALEPAARSLFVHPNTLRYRLHRIAELTDRDPWRPRDVVVLRAALILGRLSNAGGPPRLDPVPRVPPGPTTEVS